MHNAKQDDLRKYKIISLFGLIIMGIGSFMACLAEDKIFQNIGNVALCASIAIMFYSFYHWEP